MRLLSAILLTAMALSATAQGVDRARVLPRSEVDVSSTPAELRKLVRSGYLADLRWPDFADYRQSLESLYEASGYSPVWFANGRLSVQARALIAVIESASEKGLNPQDYDASKLSEWADQLGSVTSAGGTARLDVGLSVAAMRYTPPCTVDESIHKERSSRWPDEMRGLLSLRSFGTTSFSVKMCAKR